MLTLDHNDRNHPSPVIKTKKRSQRCSLQQIDSIGDRIHLKYLH
ncbi:hypothetical protein [Chlorogloeopsis fritschii]|nr:hypothetical protein [Chlorogloeopsis fritschii]